MKPDGFRPDRYINAVIPGDGTANVTVTVPDLNLWVVTCIAGTQLTDGLTEVNWAVRLNGVNLWGNAVGFGGIVQIQPTFPMWAPAYPGDTLEAIGSGGTAVDQLSVTVSGLSYGMPHPIGS